MLRQSRGVRSKIPTDCELLKEWRASEWESMPRLGTGNRREMASSPSTARDCSRASSGIASVQPEQTSVTTSLLMKKLATSYNSLHRRHGVSEWTEQRLRSSRVELDPVSLVHTKW